MVDQPEAATSERKHWRLGVAYAVLAAGLATAFLFLPILMLGVTMDVVASVAAGEPVAWRSSVDMTYVLVGPVALLSTLLLLIPFKLLQAATRRLSPTRAIAWAGGLLAAALSGVGLLYLLAAQARGLPQTSAAPEFWYAAAFGSAALVTVTLSTLIARRAYTAAFAVVGLATAGLVVLVATLVAAWGS